MTFTPELLLGIFLAWQIGSMPLPLWIGKAFYAYDLHLAGNRSEYVENVFSNFSKQTAFIIFGLEFLKGWAAVSIAFLVDATLPAFETVFVYKLYLAGAVMIGQLFPVFGEFKGQNSLGVFFGIIVALWPVAGIASLTVFGLLWILTKRITISSIFLALSMMIIFTLVLSEAGMPVVALILSFVVAGIQVIHYFNTPKTLKHN